MKLLESLLLYGAIACLAVAAAFAALLTRCGGSFT